MIYQNIMIKKNVVWINFRACCTRKKKQKKKYNRNKRIGKLASEAKHELAFIVELKRIVSVFPFYFFEFCTRHHRHLIVNFWVVESERRFIETTRQTQRLHIFWI